MRRPGGRHCAPVSPLPGLDGGIPPADQLAAVGTIARGGIPGPRTPDPTYLLTDPVLPLGDVDPPPNAPKPAATQIAEGLPLVSAKLAARILRGEFIEMHELLPEFLVGTKEGAKTPSRARAKRRAQDINVWLQCFAMYVGVMAPEYPTRVPKLMGYMVLILRASRESEGSARAVYDDAYRRQAETSGQCQWSHVNPSLYSVCFTGKAAKAARCERCLSAGHATDDCSLPGEEDPDVSKRLRAIESAIESHPGQSTGRHLSPPDGGAVPQV